MAVLTLALGIGANTTAFSWLNAILLNPLPGVAGADMLVSITGATRAQPLISFSHQDYRDYRDRNQSLSGFIAFDDVALSLSGEEAPERVWGQIVSGNFFDVLGVRARYGRTFLPDEDKAPGTHPVAVISHELWQERFHGEPFAAGRIINLNNHPFTVVGIAPPEFQGTVTGLRFDVWVPIMMQRQIVPGTDRLEQRGNRWLNVMGRVKPDVSLKQARAEFSVIADQLARAYPDTNDGVRIEIYPLWKAPGGASEVMGSVLLALMALMGVVLLIACANVANLLLARATSRRKEIAIRIALGAKRAALIRQLLVESILLALMSGAVGVVISLWTTGLLVALAPPIEIPFRINVAPDARVLAFTLAVSIATGLAFGLAPALNATRAELAPALKDEAAGGVGGRKTWLRNALVVAQVSLSLVLLVAAGLFLRSLQKAQGFYPGFNPRNVLLMGVDLFPSGYSPEQGQRFFRQLVEQLESLPGVRSATLSRRVPLGFGGYSTTSIRVEGFQPAKDEEVWTYSNTIGPNYFRTMEIPLLRGRDFTQRDNENGSQVAIVNDSFASRFWKGGDPIGKRVEYGTGWVTVVGVARDSRYRRLVEPPSPMLFRPVLQSYQPSSYIHVRSGTDPRALAPAVQGVVRSLDPNLPVFNIQTLEAHISASSFQQRLAGSLLGVFGMLALTLAAVGLYGVISYAVGQRTREIGIRVALGAQEGDILRLVVRLGVGLAMFGVGIGLAAAVALSRLLTGLLFGITSTDPITYFVVAAMLVSVALLASYIPALRATRIDPMAALRYE